MQNHRFICIVAGRRWGKTFLFGYDLIYNAFKTPGHYAYVAPTLKMSRELMLSFLMEKLYPAGIKNFNKTDMFIELHNGSKINLYGAAAYDSIRGQGFHGVYGDEIAYWEQEAYTEVIRPTLSTTKGYFKGITTPAGKANWAYDLTLDSEFKVYHRKSIDGGWIEASEIEAAQRQLDERTYKQEYEASFETSGSTVYYAYSEENNCNRVYKPGLRTLISWDFNVNPLCTIILQEFEPDKWAAVREFVIANQNTEAQCQMIDKFFSERGRPVTLEVCGDSTASRHQSCATTTDYNIIETYFKNYAGYGVKRMRPPRAKHRTVATNAMFRNSKGEIKLYINKNLCPRLDRDLKVTEWKENGSEIDKKPGISDPSDALSYFPFNYYPIRFEQERILV